MYVPAKDNESTQLVSRIHTTLIDFNIIILAEVPIMTTSTRITAYQVHISPHQP
jgi:hypothetical protein